jgi:2-amino-4-hydroxy-6-hydroxymethyldihydropteridine diphosphokinase
MSRVPEVFVAAGSNVEPHRRLRQALAMLAAAYPGLRVSPAYANKAVGFEGDEFVNLVVGFATAEPLASVLATLHGIEEACGRPRNAAKWAPRAMDLDVLLYGDEVGAFPGVVLPRPDLVKRAFMLGPLADLAPDLVHPTERITIGELWRRFDRGAHALRPTTL